MEELLECSLIGTELVTVTVVVTLGLITAINVDAGTDSVSDFDGLPRRLGSGGKGSDLGANEILLISPYSAPHSHFVAPFGKSSWQL
jgi:hypothetical protein